MTERHFAPAGTQLTFGEPIPQAIVLATWLRAWLNGSASSDDVLGALEIFGPHRFSNGTDEEGLFTGLNSIGVAPGRDLQLRAVLPVPGDPSGLSGPPAFNQAATESGQALLIFGSGHGLIPRTGPTTTWLASPIDESNQRTPDISPEQASSEVRAALLEATNSLAGFTQSVSREEIAGELTALNRALDRTRLPRSLDSGRQHTIRLAAQVHGICQIAAHFTSQQPTSGATAGQAVLLAQLSRTARRALAASASSR